MKICFHDKQLVDWGCYGFNGYWQIYCCSKCGKLFGEKERKKLEAEYNKDIANNKKAFEYYNKQKRETK